MDWLDRLKTEQAELQNKIDKLNAFLDNPKLMQKVDSRQIDLMQQQVKVMRNYNFILLQRAMFAQ